MNQQPLTLTGIVLLQNKMRFQVDPLQTDVVFSRFKSAGGQNVWFITP